MIQDELFKNVNDNSANNYSFDFTQLHDNENQLTLKGGRQSDIMADDCFPNQLFRSNDVIILKEDMIGKFEHVNDTSIQKMKSGSKPKSKSSKTKVSEKESKPKSNKQQKSTPPTVAKKGVNEGKLSEPLKKVTNKSSSNSKQTIQKSPNKKKTQFNELKKDDLHQSSTAIEAKKLGLPEGTWHISQTSDRTMIIAALERMANDLLGPHSSKKPETQLSAIQEEKGKNAESLDPQNASSIAKSKNIHSKEGQQKSPLSNAVNAIRVGGHSYRGVTKHRCTGRW